MIFMRILLFAFFFISCSERYPLLNPDDFFAETPLLTVRGKVQGQQSSTIMSSMTNPRIGFLPLAYNGSSSSFDSTLMAWHNTYPLLCSDSFRGSFPLNFIAAFFKVPSDTLLTTVTMPDGKRVRLFLGSLILFDDRNSNGQLDMASKDGNSLPGFDTVVAISVDRLLVYVEDESFLDARETYARMFHNPEDRWIGLAKGYSLTRFNPALLSGGRFNTKFAGLEAQDPGEKITLWTDSTNDLKPVFFFQTGSGGYYLPPQTKSIADAHYYPQKFKAFYDFVTQWQGSMLCWDSISLARYRKEAADYFREESVKSDLYYYYIAQNDLFAQGWDDVYPDMVSGSFRFISSQKLNVPNPCSYRGYAIESAAFRNTGGVDTVWSAYKDPGHHIPWPFGLSNSRLNFSASSGTRMYKERDGF